MVATRAKELKWGVAAKHSYQGDAEADPEKNKYLFGEEGQLNQPFLFTERRHCYGNKNINIQTKLS